MMIQVFYFEALVFEVGNEDDMHCIIKEGNGKNSQLTYTVSDWAGVSAAPEKRQNERKSQSQSYGTSERWQKD